MTEVKVGQVWRRKADDLNVVVTGVGDGAVSWESNGSRLAFGSHLADTWRHRYEFVREGES